MNADNSALDPQSPMYPLARVTVEEVFMSPLAPKFCIIDAMDEGDADARCVRYTVHDLGLRKDVFACYHNADPAIDWARANGYTVQPRIY